MKGQAFIKDGGEAEEVGFNPESKSFKHDEKKYNVLGAGLFKYRPHWYSKVKLLSFYEKGKRDPLILDESIPTITPEELKIMDEERITHRGFKSLRTPFALPGRALFFIILLIIIVAGVVWYTTMGPGAGGGEENIIGGIIP